MTSTIEETIFVTQDTYISSDAPGKNEDSFPLLNVGRSENGSLNRVLLKGDFGNMEGKVVKEAKLCLFQIYNGMHTKDDDIFYLHEVNRKWSEKTATWDELSSSSPIGNLVSTGSFSVEEDIKVCFHMDPARIINNRFGYILKGEEDSDKHDRWFRSSEYVSDTRQVYSEATSDLYHPHFVVKTFVDPNPAQGGNVSGSSKTFKPNSLAFILAITFGSLAFILLATVAFVKRRNRYYQEEASSIESEESKKDFVDNLGEMFGVVSSSDDEETYNTRDTTVYTGNDEIEVQDYRRSSVGERVHNALFGIPEEETTTTDEETEVQDYHRPSVGERVHNALFGISEEETTTTDDRSYISRWYRNTRR